jgi:tetratricopeptide (TPR) repeat protein
VASNPRIDDLRKRLDKDPGSRLFAQLAEELRKDGELEEAIRVSREGLQKHPAYPSARMTLGRALLDTGDIAAARLEFETVLKGAPDNILASRFLGECLEGLGDLAGARDRYKATLALAPGDKQVTAHLRELESKLKASAAPSGPTTAAAEPSPVPPIPVARVVEPMELERSVEARPPSARPAPMPSPSPEATVVMSSTPTVVLPPAPPAPAAAPAPAPAAKGEGPAEPPPIPLVAAEEDFELERPFETPTPSLSPPAPPETRGWAAPPAPDAPAYEPPSPPSEFEFDLAPDAGGTASVPAPWRLEPEAAPPARPLEPEPEPEAEPPIPPPPAAVAAPVPPPPIPPPAVAWEPERVVQAAPPLPPPVFAPTPAPPPARRVEAPSPPPLVEAARAPQAEADDLTSSTLAELYFNQGFTDKAIEVYRQLLQREPGNERGRTRLGDLEALERRIKDEEARSASAPGSGAADAAAARRQAIERTIARLEGLLTALRKE